ncbi:MAG: HEAT repeat domain-containing protein, partial [Candidatus Riflebacteria bacterium]|nr:HEAT repeat domain-containing protein [Candidatus Riflebacteria bacterium]
RATEDTNNRVLANLAIALGPLDPLESLRILTRLLNSADKWERASAVYAAGFIEETRVGGWLTTTLMYEDDEDVIRNIIASLSRFRDPSLLEQLLKGLVHPKQIVRFGTARILGNVGDRACRSALLSAIEGESNAGVKAEMIGALGKLSDTSHIPQVARFLKDGDPRVQANTIEALDHIGSPEIIPYVKPFITSLDNRVKANAAKALWTQGTLDVVSTLAQMMDSPGEREVLSAIYALGEIGRSPTLALDSHRYFLLTSALHERARDLFGEEPGLVRASESEIISTFLSENWTLFERFVMGDCKDAKELLDKALDKPTHPVVHFIAGEMFRRMENFQRAGQCLALAEEQLSRFVAVLTSQANLHHQVGDTRGSISYHLKALRDRVSLVSDEVDVALNMAKMDRLEEATLLLRSLMDQSVSDGRVHWHVGRQAFRYGDQEKAFRHLFFALAEDAQDGQVWHDLAVVAQRLGHVDVARRLLTHLAESAMGDELAVRARELLGALREGQQ